MRRQITLRALFGCTTLACGFAAATAIPEPYGYIPLTVVLVAMIVCWPWMFGHGA